MPTEPIRSFAACPLRPSKPSSSRHRWANITGSTLQWQRRLLPATAHAQTKKAATVCGLRSQIAGFRLPGTGAEEAGTGEAHRLTGRLGDLALLRRGSFRLLRLRNELGEGLAHAGRRGDFRRRRRTGKRGLL